MSIYLKSIRKNELKYNLRYERSKAYSTILGLFESALTFLR